MHPPNEVHVPAGQPPGVWETLTTWIRLNRPFAWLVGLTIGLLVFLVWLPPYVRAFFWRGLQAHSLLASMTLGFGLVALSLLWSNGQRIDAWLFLFFNLRGARPIWLDRLMWVFTQFGNSITSFAFAVVLFLAGDRLLAYELILGTLTLWFVVELVKALVRRRRPFLRLSDVRVVGHRERGRSFPSGHTSQAFFVATLMVGYFQLSVWVICLLYVMALVVGITRMYVGAHYPRDVLAGIILGSAWGLLAGIVYG